MDEKCLADPDWWSEDKCRPYYLAARLSARTPFSSLDGAEPLQRHQAGSGVEHAGFRGGHWQRVRVDVAWRRGPMAGAETDQSGADHWHANLQVGEYPVHIDFIRFGAMGPQRQYREYRVFVSAHEIARGGGFLGFLGGVFGCLRSWPLAVVFDEHLIYIDRLLQDWVGTRPGQLSATDVLSVWRELDPVGDPA